MLTKRTINIISIVVPLLVLAMFQVKFEGDFDFLPHIYAPINALTALLLPIAIYQIKKGNRKAHEYIIKTAISLSVVFLGMYLVYHATSEETKFGGDGSIRYVYFFFLITHILFSIGVVPMVLHTYFRAATEQFKKHKKLGKITFFVWEYVAISGVIVYLMIRPYY